jgi:AhpC/TSA antioxidant enzyme
MNLYHTLRQTQRQRVSDGTVVPLLSGCDSAQPLLVLVWPQLGDFDSLEYAWWLQRYRPNLPTGLQIRAIGIGDLKAGQKFCEFTQFPTEELYLDPQAQLHRELGLYPGTNVGLPGFSAGQKAWLNLILMCAGLGSPGTLAEVWRGYRGDRQAPQLIGDAEIIQAKSLPPLSGRVFRWAGGSGFQRPFELATLRLRNMAEVLSNWRTYVPDAAYLTQRGGTFLFKAGGELCYQHHDRGILGFAEKMSDPLSFLQQLVDEL